MARVVTLFVHYEEGEPEHTMKLELQGEGLALHAALQRFADAYAKLGGSLDPSRLRLVTESGRVLGDDAVLPCGMATGSDLFVTVLPGGAKAPPAKAPPVYAAAGSAVAASQAKMGENSYYYSVGKNRAPAGTAAAAPVQPPAPRAVNTEERRLIEQTLTSYSMIDDGPKVKLHIPIAGVNTLPAGAVVAEFRFRSLDVKVASGSKLLRLHIPLLCEEIAPAACGCRARPGKLIVSLAKVEAERPWHELRKTKGIGDTEYNKLVPDAGEPTTVAI